MGVEMDLGLLDWIAPLGCMACDLPLTGDGRTAAAPFPGGERFCAACRVLIEPSAEPWGPYAFGGPLAHAIHRLKYQNRTDIADALGQLWVGSCRDLGGKVDVIVPMPLHRLRLFRRGYNQVTLLARPVSRDLGVPIVGSRLVRTRATAPQVSLAPEARRENVRGAFRARRVEGLRVLLLDDVRTTGATLEAAEGALWEGGAKAVWSRCLAVAAGRGAASRAA
ncbi:MAG: ComF family protein [Myxococcales bacterium]|nr:ComF family protein [Myxococcales bacterium]